MSSMTDIRRDDIADGIYSTKTCVAWGAIIAGAFAAAAISLILLILGSALGLSSVSPWSHPETVAAFTVKTAIWLIVMQWIASGVGGYLTGRLRSKWLNMHTDEVFFRDTAHGFLAWAVATVLTATVLASAATSIVSGGVHAVVTVAAGAAANPTPRPENDANGYYIDSLFRSGAPSANADTKDVRAETTRILMVDLKNGSVPDADKAYLAQLVSARTGLNQTDASARVDDVVTQLSAAKDKAKQDAEEARKTAMHVSIYIFLSLLIGAFIASCAAALGGRHRDEY